MILDRYPYAYEFPPRRANKDRLHPVIARRFPELAVEHVRELAEREVKRRLLLEMRAIGYFRGLHGDSPELPDPRDYIDRDWDATERDIVIAYLREGQVFEEWRGLSECRFGSACWTPRSKMGTKCLYDGVFIWPEGFSHYLERHFVKPPEEFVRHAIERAFEKEIGVR